MRNAEGRYSEAFQSSYSSASITPSSSCARFSAHSSIATSWALKHFGDHEIAIVYHDDNARGIPHAHIVVNNANLRTGYRMQTRHPEDLNRGLQDMARELSGLY